MKPRERVRERLGAPRSPSLAHLVEGERLPPKPPGPRPDVPAARIIVTMIVPHMPVAALLLWAVPSLQDAPQAPATPPVQANTPPSASAPDDEAQADKVRIATYYEGALLDTENGQDFHETSGYRRMLDQISRYSTEELAVKAERHLDVPAALADPDAWRGEIVRWRGIVAGIETVRLRDPLGERVDVYRTVLMVDDGSEGEGVVVDSLDRPPALELQRDVVDVEGVFYRTVRYQNRRGESREAPYLLSRGLRRLDLASEPRSTRFDTYAILLIGAIGVFFVFRILIPVVRGNRKRRAGSVSAESSRALREHAFANKHEEKREPGGG